MYLIVSRIFVVHVAAASPAQPCSQMPPATTQPIPHFVHLFVVSANCKNRKKKGPTAFIQMLTIRVTSETIAWRCTQLRKLKCPVEQAFVKGKLTISGGGTGLKAFSLSSKFLSPFTTPAHGKIQQGQVFPKCTLPDMQL